MCLKKRCGCFRWTERPTAKGSTSAHSPTSPLATPRWATGCTTSRPSRYGVAACLMAEGSAVWSDVADGLACPLFPPPPPSPWYNRNCWHKTASYLLAYLPLLPPPSPPPLPTPPPTAPVSSSLWLVGWYFAGFLGVVHYGCLLPPPPSAPILVFWYYWIMVAPCLPPSLPPPHTHPCHHWFFCVVDGPLPPTSLLHPPPPFPPAQVHWFLCGWCFLKNRNWNDPLHTPIIQPLFTFFILKHFIYFLYFETEAAIWTERPVPDQLPSKLHGALWG